MEEKEASLNVNAEPTKSFFVNMLTRDIELKDAILDLLDNCIDGVLRQQKGKDPVDAYKNHYAEITIDDQIGFCLSDNCGGIPLTLAKEYAFQFGRRDSDRDAGIPTVGMYGIGMKRAIFKLGESAEITTQTGQESYTVTIPKDWVTTKLWEFPLKKEETAPFSEPGTSILIKQLRDPVKTKITTAKFLEDLEKTISSHYALLIEKGFTVKLNGKSIRPISLELSFVEEEEIWPYVYKADIDDVHVRLVVGFRTMPFSEEQELEELKHKSSSDEAGWTVVCNDRVVLHNDKTRATGWGDPPVPNFHTQFINISGVVEFTSPNAENLPLTTTKRGIDANSDIYQYVKRFMKEGLKEFTNHTNRWKQYKDEESELFSNHKTKGAVELADYVLNEKSASVRNPQNKFNSKASVQQTVFKPKLPSPKSDNRTRKIAFSRDVDDIQKVADFLLEDPSARPTEVGEACFDEFLKEAKDQ